MSRIKEVVKVVEVIGGGSSYVIEPIEKYIAFQTERALTCSFAMNILGKVMGKVLTVIDASVSEKTQNKAMKDLIRGIMSNMMEIVSENAFDQEYMCKVANENCPEDIDTEGISVEEALGVKQD